MSKKELQVIILLVEGDTEVEFYAKVRQLLMQKLTGSENCEFLKPINIKGIGNYKNNAARQFENAMKKFTRSRTPQKNCKQKKNDKKGGKIKYTFHAFMCIDTDVLNSHVKPMPFGQNPPINENEIINTIKAKNGIPHFIKAVHCIEDWFLEDKDGIIKYLKIDKFPKLDNNKGGAKNLNSVFKKGGKLYTKGARSEGFIDSLDVSTILQNHIDDFYELKNLMK